MTTAAPRLEHREAERVEQFGRIGAGAGGEEGRVLEQPDALALLTRTDRRGALFHEVERFLVRHGRGADAPFHICAKGRGHLAEMAAPTFVGKIARSARGPHKLPAIRTGGTLDGQIIDLDGVG
jgi:hypothetical protein